MDDRLTPREEIWIRAWTAVAGASNSVNKSSAVSWADDCLKNYDARFGGKAP
jgi:hypothetical protein